MEIALLNSLVVTVPGFYKAEKITLEDAQQWLKYYEGRYKSFIGHKSTAQFLQELLGIKVEQNRKIFRHMKYQKAICFSLNERYPENVVLSKKDLEKAKYQFYLLTRLD
ncbi:MULTISPECIES: YddF family protein [Bacillus mojavensis subgroup]|uniref:YddF family protein n=1 Tax=Bacillus mojavensis subgroup TaxID=653388 RepID=UPI002281550A|nr:MULTISPECIES: YddF family protein [Bacillus mojavensis subgroup]MCY9089363.1 YddF family protein [Bacillus mojavensis]MEC1664500.1 YddF family protein [Bacillus halotolerans]